MPVAMMISPHADDAAAFCGATLAKFADTGWDVILVRVTNDSKDSVGFSIPETIELNTKELEEAANILGVKEIVQLGYETDCLGDVSKVELREKFVYLYRKYKPYAVFTFDPFGKYENNLDHIVVAQTADEAFWVSCFDKHHPEHFKEGLEPYAVVEKWYIARNLQDPNYAVDITDYLEKKILAFCAHKQMVKHILHQANMQVNRWGRRMPWLEESIDGDPRPLVSLFLQEQANAVAEQFNLGKGRMGEVYRLERFGDLEPLFQAFSEPIPGFEAPPSRDGLDQPPPESPWNLTQLESMYPMDIEKRIRLMGHHHLCAGAFDYLLRDPGFQMVYAELVNRLTPSPDLEIESIYGYDIFCYQCEYWSEEEGRCSTGWKDKISKDAAVLEHLELKTGQVTRLEDLQRRLAEKVPPSKLAYFCAGGDWKCEFYALGACQVAYADLREKYNILIPEEEKS